jgi:hypothetical protein
MKRFFLLGVVATSLGAQTTIDVPVVDLPYNAAHGLRAPSMQQSLGLSAAMADAAHLAIQDSLEGHPFLMKLSVGGFDILTNFIVPLPLSDTWLHEEWHRAVMGWRGIDSFNDVYHFKLAPDSIAVSHVRDEDLIRLKRDHPADLVRLGEAGIEGEHALVERLEKERFFGDSRAWHLPLYWLVKLGAQAYVGSSTDDEVNGDVDRMNAEDGPSIKRRDFTGPDFTGWMYDLSRPNEPYEARGIHPSGVGIDRYRKPADLTQHEKDFLARQGHLQWINFADSNLLGIDGFGHRVRWNVTGAHLLTSFGYTVDANVFLRAAERNVFVVIHRYTNDARSFPGLDAELLGARVTPRLALWSQPERFADRGGAFGGLASVRIAMARGTYVEVVGKTKGWVSGNEALGKSLAVRLGVTRVMDRRTSPARRSPG